MPSARYVSRSSRRLAAVAPMHEMCGVEREIPRAAAGAEGDRHVVRPQPQQRLPRLGEARGGVVAARREELEAETAGVAHGGPQ
jgi:hypothetical protein